MTLASCRSLQAWNQVCNESLAMSCEYPAKRSGVEERVYQKIERKVCNKMGDVIEKDKIEK